MAAIMHKYHADGYDEPILIDCVITVNDEDIVIDYSGSSSEVPWPLNGVHNFTFAYTVYPLKCAIGPGIPNNSGTLRPFKVIAPEGSVLNCRHHRRSGLRHINGIMLHAALYRAMYDAIPEKIIAPSGSPSAIAVIAGRKKMASHSLPTSSSLAGWAPELTEMALIR